MTRIRHARPNPFIAFGPASVGAMLLAACATTPAPTAREPQGPRASIEAGTSSKAARVAVPRDGDPAKLAQVIAALTEAHARDRNDVETSIALAEAHYVMAQSIAVLGWKSQGEPADHWLKSIDAVADDEGGAALYWRAASAYASSQRSGYGALLHAQPTVQRMMEEAARTAPSTDRGGPHRVLASLAAHPAHPALRDLPRARQHAEAALAIDGRAAANVSAFIEHYAVPAQDRAALTEKLRLLSELVPAASDDAVAGALAERLAATVEDRLE